MFFLSLRRQEKNLLSSSNLCLVVNFGSFQIFQQEVLKNSVKNSRRIMEIKSNWCSKRYLNLQTLLTISFGFQIVEFRYVFRLSLRIFVLWKSLLFSIWFDLIRYDYSFYLLRRPNPKLPSLQMNISVSGCK